MIASECLRSGQIARGNSPNTDWGERGYILSKLCEFVTGFCKRVFNCAGEIHLFEQAERWAFPRIEENDFGQIDLELHLHPLTGPGVILGPLFPSQPPLRIAAGDCCPTDHRLEGGMGATVEIPSSGLLKIEI
jgi:hypothetical protein